MVNSDIAKSIFLTAIDMPAAERTDYLIQAAAGDAALRERVQALLNAHQESDDFLERPAVQLDAPYDAAPSELPLAEGPGTVIGPYQLREQIGEGGMGVVYLADQKAPVGRQVALKIIKPGMDTRQVIARFEVERQALGLMDHPNIARVLDAGTTDSGRPYFVMELVHGIPITEYCQQNGLSVQARLELFVQVCHAVQHAHQKGIIHRDLKPPNVLVTRCDGQDTAKVIDFGVAKAINQQVAEITRFTNIAQMVGTPLYMSPEQAEITGQDIDTRSDIYSLGVVLYEVLTGTTPFDRQRFREAAYDEIRRIILEEEPPRPSSRINALGGRTAATTRHAVDRHRSRQLIRGDLDWIVMKALDKDRNRRYVTANALARDIQRYLSDQPVEACPPSTTYRFRKFARRNGVALSMAVLVSASLIAGTVLSTWQAIRATRAELRAETSREAEAEQRARAEEHREQSDANFQKARKAVDEYFTLVSESKLLDVPGLQSLRIDLLQAALGFYRELAHQRSNDPAVLADLAATHLRVAAVFQGMDRNDDAFEALLSGLEIVDQLRRDHPGAVEQHRKLAGFWKGRRAVTAADSKLPRDPVAVYQAIVRLTGLWERFAAENPETVGFQSDLAAIDHTLADLLLWSGNREQGLVFLQKSRTFWDRLVRENPTVPEYREELARACVDAAEYLPAPSQSEEALEAIRQALALREQLAKDFPDVPQYRLDLAESLKHLADGAARTGRFDDAEAAYRRAVELCRELVDKFPGVPLHSERLVETQHEFMKLLELTGQVSEDEARQSHVKAIEAVEKLANVFPADSFFRSHLARCYRDLAYFLKAHGSPQEAILAHREEKRHLDALPPQDLSRPFYRSAMARNDLNMGELLVASGQSKEGAMLCRRALDSYVRLVAEFPANAGYVRDVEECHRRMAGSIVEETPSNDRPADPERAK